jgi:hypothetical protein
MLRIVFMLAFLGAAGAACDAAVYDPPPETLKEARDEARAEADLQAQMEMAYWAKVMFFWTAASVLIAAGGIIGLGFNFWQTRKALHHASRSNELVELQGRPWLQFENIYVQHTEVNGETANEQLMAIITFDVVNTGLSPALLVYNSHSTYVPSSGENEFKATMREIETCALDGVFIAPGARIPSWMVGHGKFAANGSLNLMAVFAAAYSDGARSKRMQTVLTGFVGIRQPDVWGMPNETPMGLSVAALAQHPNVEIMQKRIMRMT